MAGRALAFLILLGIFVVGANAAPAPVTTKSVVVTAPGRSFRLGSHIRCAAGHTPRSPAHGYGIDSCTTGARCAHSRPRATSSSLRIARRDSSRAIAGWRTTSAGRCGGSAARAQAAAGTYRVGCGLKTSRSRRPLMGAASRCSRRLETAHRHGRDAAAGDTAPVRIVAVRRLRAVPLRRRLGRQDRSGQGPP
jgi:hypothetical protein